MRTYAWCTYRDWSFHVLEGLLDLPDWRCGLLITTEDCRTDLGHFERLGIPVLRIKPSVDLKAGGVGMQALTALRPSAIFHYGWSWLVPRQVLDLCPNVTLHPGKLPRDRGGSPIQNQIRNGEEVSFANLIRLVPELDEGPIYDREKFSLRGGDVDGVWARMVSAGIVVSRRFLGAIAAGSAAAVPQDASVQPTIYKRVSPEQAELRLERQTARQIYDVIRAHNETDSNTYVVRAWIELGDYKVVIDRADLDQPVDARLVLPDDRDWMDNPYETAHAVNDGAACLVLRGCDGRPVHLTRLRIAPMRPLAQRPE